jgi:CheY-like chemotaxis protein
MVLPVQDCIERAVGSARPLLDAKHHGLTITPTIPPLYVHVDRERLQQCLVNLLGNAAKFTPPHGEIRIHTHAEIGQVMIEISDSGLGISPELLPRVFDSFVQNDQSLDRSEGGLGLGLSICKLVIELHGGTINARSAGPGSGSTFTIRLPLVGARTATAKTAASPLKSRVLIVDDNQDAANSLAMLLQLQGYETKTVYSAESALEQAVLFDPRIVLLDIGLPGMDGFEVAARLKTLITAAPRIIAISGYAQADDKQRSLAAGFDAHLLKPVTLESLTAYLHA